MENEKKRPLVGIGVMITDQDGRVLLGLRQNAHGQGEWSFPGGHLEFGETIVETAKRETMEEVGLEIDDLELISVFDEFRYIESAGKHYLNIGLRGRCLGGEPQLLEPDKCVEWRYFSLDELPSPLFESTEAMIKNFQTGKIYQ